MRSLLILLLLCTFGLQAWAERIPRNKQVIREFRQANPCPATGRASGACPGFQVDHAVPLCAGGTDTVDNLHWLDTENHAWKTRVDTRECRKLRRMASTPAQ